MDSILHYTSVSHAGSLMAGINRLRITADLCDVTVVVGDYRILAHKIILSASSPFFYQMLKIKTKPETSNCSEVLLESVDAIAALKIIEFCYTSAISLDDDNVWPLFEAAIKFQFAEICSLCCEFLTAGLDVSNCILSLRLATRLRFSQLEENCAKYLTDNLQKVSKSQSLVSLSAQELSSVLSILEFHRTNVEVTATLAQAWLEWDRKTRADFVPKLKLLLPALGDLVDGHLRDGGNIISDQASHSFADEEGNDKKAAKESGDPLLQTVTYDKSPSSSSSVICTESSTVATVCQSSPKSAGESQANGNGKNSSINTSNASGDNEDGKDVVEPKDFICVSCGDEFECDEDLAVHGRQCDESINIVKSVDGKGAQSLSSDSFHEENPGNEKNDSVKNKIEDTIAVNNLKNSQLNAIISENKTEDSVELSYPKTRRSLRNRKSNVKNVDAAEEKSHGPDEENSHPVSEESRVDEDISFQKDENGEERDTIKQGQNDSGKEDGDLEGSNEEEMETEIRNGVRNRGHNCDTMNEVTSWQVSSVNDSNNNDVLMHGSGSNCEATNSISDVKNTIVKASENIILPNETSLIGDPAQHPVEGENSDKKMRDEASDNKGSSTLRQWRQEYQNSPSGITFKESTPEHKCLICSRGFWDRKALANHWRHNHGVRSMAREEEEYVHSDQEMDQQGVVERKVTDSSKRKSRSPKNAYLTSPNVSGFSGPGICKSGCGIPKSDQGTNTSFIHDSKTDLISDLQARHGERRMLEIQKVKEEILDGKGNSFCPESSLSHKSLSDKDHSSQQKASVVEGAQITPFENVNSEASLSLNTSMEQWMRGALWSQENNENAVHGEDSPSAKAPQNVNSATDFLSNYFHEYNKLAEWCMAQGTQFCPACLGYHPLGKLCPKAATQNCRDMKDDSGREKYGPKEKDSKGVNVKKGDGEEEEGPLDMSKSSVDYSLKQLTPNTCSSSSKSSSANSSGHSSMLGVPPFFNFSNALDMSTPRFGDSSQPGSFALPLRKSPLDPNSSFGPHFTSYHPSFSTASSHPSPNAGPSSSTSPNTSTPMTSHTKSSTLNGKKVTSRRGFSCTVCNRVFSYQTALFTHMHTHSPSARSYRCQLCNETFARAPDLKVHVCPNGMEKPYSCPSCGQTFAKNIHLKRHLATHSGLKPYPCWVCGKRFSRSDHLKRHTQSIHAGARPHVCQVCGKEFVRKYELNKHMQSHEQTFVVT